MVFFQAALLGGYAYAHVSTSWLGVARQARWHLVLLVLPLAVLPLGVDASLLRGGEASLVLDVLLVLTITVGLPFFVVSATAPLLQTWFTHTGHPAARDPYFLYAASNLGSMLALLAYPTLIEPKLSLRESGWLAQTHLWSAGYGLLAVLIVLCTLTVPRIASVNPTAAADERRETIPLTRRLSWMAFAFVPSSLLLGATTYITTDIAAVPLLWVPPLAIYLLSFIIAFGRYPLWLQRAVESATLPVILAVLFLLVSGFRQRIWISVLWHLLLLLVVALACHGMLARDRPGPSRLTEFYLLISVGGVLGGLLNALIAPAMFDSLAEYPLVMVLAGLLVGRSRMASAGQSPAYLLDVILGLGTGMLALVLYSDTLSFRFDFAFLTRALGLASGGPQWLDTLEQALNKLVVYAPPLILAFRWRRRPLSLGTALVGVLVVAGFVESRNIAQIHQARSFFGVLRVTRDRAETGYTELRHGTTLHGRQSLEGKRRGEPLSYYHRAGPMGQIFAEFDRRATLRRIAVIGLGTGTLAAYAQPGDRLVFYEIDPLVQAIALDRAYFTYLSDAQARGVTVRVELGDARVRLERARQEQPDERYDLIVVDAFSSDAVPVHLLTRQALQLYLEMLTPRGLLALHLSNRYLDLERVAANLAEDAGLGGRLLQHDEAGETQGGTRSTWAVLARTAEALGELALDARWTVTQLEGDPRVGVWTDDFHNPLSIMRW